ncbi:hypothetical protein V2A60_005180 [Cordyceps javanica]|uniref:Thiamine pyrophosphokinase n=1 Tax=Cordyceps javanica TaxID=43265 RepID=A0A545W9C0_9HYPO|nr:thiamine pyrophosphokinase [Cordyceps javanica]TQW10591.1 thiamine pyrophosphokinase [Cordyceps javanica]
MSTLLKPLGNIPAFHPGPFHKVIDTANKFDKTQHKIWPLFILDSSGPVGYIIDEFMAEMDWKGTSFHVSETEVHLDPALGPGEDRVEACKREFLKLCEINKSRFNGCLEHWLSSKQRRYEAIRWFDDRESMLLIPTPLRGILGIATAGVHLNVYSLIDGVPWMWVAQRSEQASYPGMMDQLVAGGMDPEDGYDAWRTLEHEAMEEAGLYLDTDTSVVSHNGIDLGTVHGPTRISFFDKKDHKAGAAVGHIEPGVRFVFDLEVPVDFFPTVSDRNAIANFTCMSMADVQSDLLSYRWKPNSALAAIDFMLRMGYIDDSGLDEEDQLGSRLDVELPMVIE